VANGAHQIKGIWGWALTKWVIGLSLLLFVLIYIEYGFSEVATRHVIRWSARISFVLFCTAFAASSIHRIFKNTGSYWLFFNRKYIGVSFALSHMIHLVILGILQYAFHPVFNLAKTTSLIGGGIAYGFIVLMLITSFTTFSIYLTQKQWKILHTVGGYWIWSIFMTTYWKRATTEIEYAPYVATLVLVILIRLWSLWNSRRTAPT
jgi:hypothetical protein